MTPESPTAHLRGLKKSWNGYDADPPNDLAIANADRFIEAVGSSLAGTLGVSPSAIGGVAVHADNGDATRHSHAEFLNTGSCCYLWDDDTIDDVDLLSVGTFDLDTDTPRIVRDFLMHIGATK